jgi:hypothetical protein
MKREEKTRNAMRRAWKTVEKRYSLILVTNSKDSRGKMKSKRVVFVMKRVMMRIVIVVVTDEQGCGK